MTNLSAANSARLQKELNKIYRWSDGSVSSLSDYFNSKEKIIKLETDGFIDWNRRKFNNMNAHEQRLYEERLRAKKYYWINNIKVPKIVYDYFSER